LVQACLFPAILSTTQQHGQMTMTTSRTHKLARGLGPLVAMAAMRPH